VFDTAAMGGCCTAVSAVNTADNSMGPLSKVAWSNRMDPVQVAFSRGARLAIVGVPLAPQVSGLLSWIREVLLRVTPDSAMEPVFTCNVAKQCRALGTRDSQPPRGGPGNVSDVIGSSQCFSHCRCDPATRLMANYSESTFDVAPLAASARPVDVC
jgi:hypothetical protein